VRPCGLGEPDLVGEARGPALELRDPVLQRRALLRRRGERLRERRFRGSARFALGRKISSERAALRNGRLELLPQCAVGRIRGGARVALGLELLPQCAV
jgi:hypothetical protein